MVAPAGMNGGAPQEPAKAGRARAELRDAQAAEAEPDKMAPAGTAPGEAGPAEPAPAGAVEKAVPAGAVPPQGGPAAAETGLVAPAETGQVASAEAEQAGWDEAEEESRGVRPLVVASVVLGVIALVGVAVGVLAIVTHGFRPKTVITYRPAAAFGLRPGQCVNTGPNALDVTVLSCARPHDAEVFARFSLPATAWPGASAVQASASDGCASRFGSYLNPDLATIDLAQEFIYPNKAAWRAGERTVVCEVRSTSGQLTGSVRARG